jgi:ketosteroid isomerase-like protein
MAQIARVLAAGVLAPALLLAPPAWAQAAKSDAPSYEKMRREAEVQQKNIEIVQTALDNARAGKLDQARPYFADDFVLQVAEGIPYGGVYHGWDGYTECLRRIKEFWNYTHQDDREFLPIGDDRVMIHFMLHGQIKKNNQLVEMPVVAFWYIKNDKISRVINFYFDSKKLAEQAALP